MRQFFHDARHSLLIWNTPPLHWQKFRPTATIVSYAALSAEQETERVKLTDSLQPKTLKILDLSSVCAQISPFTSTSMGLTAAKCAAIPLGRSPNESRCLLDQTSAAMAISRTLDFSGIKGVSMIVDSAVSGEMIFDRRALLCVQDSEIGNVINRAIGGHIIAE